MAASRVDRRKVATGLGAFLLPCLLMLAVLSAFGIYPFGDQSLLIIDMNSEYIDYLAQMNESVRTGGSLLRSWNMGMGLNMLGLIAFYTSSPFNILILLFPVQSITEVVFVITLLKIGLSGLLFARYIAYAFDRTGLFAVVFSTAYALCAYNVAYASNLMWLDGAAFLPLVLLGVEKLLREDRFRLLLFALAYVFFSSYYIGYMVGVFAVLYLTVVWFLQPRPTKRYLLKLTQLGGTAALAAGCCAFLLLPAFLNLRHGQTEMFLLDFSPELQKSFVHILARMLPGAYDTLTDAGYPNIYSTVLGLLLCTAFFTHKWIPRRHKLVFGGLLGFLLFSFSCRAVYLAWHAFEDPTWFPARFSFVFSFWVLYLAMHAATRLDSLPTAGMIGAVALLLGFLLEIGTAHYPYVGSRVLAFSAVLLILYAGIWILWRRRKQSYFLALALLLVCVEAGGNTWITVQELDREFQYRKRDAYIGFRDQYTPILEEMEQRDPGVYRVEILEQRNANGGMALGYNGISHYSTTTDQSLNAFLRALGYNKGTENELRFAKTTPLTNGLLGIKYVISKQEMGGGYRLLYTAGEIAVYENICAFPLAFWTDTQTLDDPFIADNPFDLQNQIMQSLGAGNRYFIPMSRVDYRLNNLDREYGEEGYLLLSRRVQGESAYVEYRLHNPEKAEAYTYFPVWNNRFSKASLYVNGGPALRDLRYRNNTVHTLGAGEDVTLILELDSAMARIAEEYFYTLDVGAAEAAAAEAQAHSVVFERFTDTRLMGRLSAPRDGMLATTIPYDDGWEIRIDGRVVQPQRFADVFLAVPVSAGEHVLTMKYRPPGFVAGCWISGGCLAGIAVYSLYRRRKTSQAIESADNP